MTDFSLLGFAAHIGKLIAAQEAETHHALEGAAVIVETEAKAELGHYQSDAGPFVSWAELADRTKADRLAKGFTENDPGLRTGEMRDSIQHVVHGDVAYIGSDDDHMVWFELGTEKQPPRHALGGAAFRKEHEVIEHIGKEAVAWLSGTHIK